MYSTIQFKYHRWVNQIINPSTSDNSVMPNKEAITFFGQGMVIWTTGLQPVYSKPLCTRSQGRAIS